MTACEGFGETLKLMFGLMKAKTCGLSDEQKRSRRLHYCGTCKTVGTLYGQKARLLLNHDTVFLAEILTALAGENLDSWQRAFQSYNCLNLPTDEMPVALEFAATANVVLAEFKIKDHTADTNQTRWLIINKAFSKSFPKARKRLQNWRFPVAQLEDVLGEQTTREKSEFTKSPNEILYFLAEPTAQATALFFAHGAKIIGKESLHDAMFALGFAFGKLVYLLDAYLDYEKDFRHKQFNAFSAAFNVQESKLSSALRREIVERLQIIQNDTAEKLDKLPLKAELKRLFNARLDSNLSRALKTELPILATTKAYSSRRHLSFYARWQKARQTALKLTANNFAAVSWTKGWQYLPAFVIVALIAFVAPHEASKAKSWQDCAGMGFNLMFLGSLVGAVSTLPMKMAMKMAANIPPEIVGKAARKAARKLKRQAAEGGGETDGGWCSFCECCDCADGCDCIDCDSCGCDSCDCCSGCDCGGCCDC